MVSNLADRAGVNIELCGEAGNEAILFGLAADIPHLLDR
jgi:hypothetical protein